MSRATLYHGEALAALARIRDNSVRVCVTSPPYWGLRDYGTTSQLGHESTPDGFAVALVEIFREVRRTLTNDGTLWLNLGDSYARSAAKGGSGPGGKNRAYSGDSYTSAVSKRGSSDGAGVRPGTQLFAEGLKAKDLIGIPWLVAFALRRDGWYLRRDIIWEKPNCMPESTKDRPTSAHEYLFLLSRNDRYYYNAAAIAESTADQKSERTARSVWTIPTKPYAGAHFATFPEELPRRCILAGSAVGDTVLDPFGGSGTTASVALSLGRGAIHIDLNAEYIELAKQRIGPLMCTTERLSE